jgi:UDP-GlcNAc3NAcA epimerase
MKKIAIIIGARPQFIKHAPVEFALINHFKLITIHTGQHYDEKMSDVFFDQLKMRRPDYMLNAGSGSHGQMTGLMIMKIEEVLLSEKPDGVLVYGDTNSTLAGALAATKLHIPVIHIESGLRSFNRRMPEEINRVLVDHCSEILFTPTYTATKNLLNEGVEKGVYEVGDVMFDSLILAKNEIEKNVLSNDSILVTLHRPYNTDNLNRLNLILKKLNSLKSRVIFPIHPRTRLALDIRPGWENLYVNIEFIDPVSYFELIKLQMESSCIITDSGGIQKEAYLLKKKCITLRSETEWLETLENGWNTLVFDNLDTLHEVVNTSPGKYIEGLYGSGNSAIDIASILSKELN